jgi:hypothetical protein
MCPNNEIVVEKINSLIHMYLKAIPPTDLTAIGGSTELGHGPQRGNTRQCPNNRMIRNEPHS